jgi:hypothetical protein
VAFYCRVESGCRGLTDEAAFTAIFYDTWNIHQPDFDECPTGLNTNRTVMGDEPGNGLAMAESGMGRCVTNFHRRTLSSHTSDSGDVPYTRSLFDGHRRELGTTIRRFPSGRDLVTYLMPTSTVVSSSYDDRKPHWSGKIHLASFLATTYGRQCQEIRTTNSGSGKVHTWSVLLPLLICFPHTFPTAAVHRIRQSSLIAISS